MLVEVEKKREGEVTFTVRQIFFCNSETLWRWFTLWDRGKVI